MLPQHSVAVRTIFEKILRERGVRSLLGKCVTGATSSELLCADGERIPFDEAIWCTQGGAQDWLRSTALALDEAGFIAVQPTLESTNCVPLRRRHVTVTLPLRPRLRPRFDIVTIPLRYHYDNMTITVTPP